MLASPTSPRCAGARPQEPSHWICSQTLRFSSGIASGVIARWPAGALDSILNSDDSNLNLDSNLNATAWPTGCRGFICSDPKSTGWSLNFFKTPKLRTAVRRYHPPDCCGPVLAATCKWGNGQWLANPRWELLEHNYILRHSFFHDWCWWLF